MVSAPARVRAANSGVYYEVELVAGSRSRLAMGTAGHCGEEAANGLWQVASACSGSRANQDDRRVVGVIGPDFACRSSGSGTTSVEPNRTPTQWLQIGHSGRRVLVVVILAVGQNRGREGFGGLHR
jgi:hypothetical protein